MSTSPALLTSLAISLAASAMSYSTLLNAPVASGYLRSCSMIWRSIVTTEHMVISGQASRAPRAASSGRLLPLGVAGHHLERVRLVPVAQVTQDVEKWKHQRATLPLAHMGEFVQEQPSGDKIGRASCRERGWSTGVGVRVEK